MPHPALPIFAKDSVRHLLEPPIATWLDLGRERSRGGLFILNGKKRMDEVPQWFWTTLDAARPDLGRLRTWLESASRQEIEDFQIGFENAKEALTDGYGYNGPNTVEIDGIVFSEDDKEDLCAWIVAHGQRYWEAALAVCDDLSGLAREYMAAERNQEDPVQKWHEVAGVLAAKVYYERFDANFHTALQERHSP
jgi:hypothetical protein